MKVAAGRIVARRNHFGSSALKQPAASGVRSTSRFGSATLYGMKARGANARGVAVIDDKTPESDLDAMGRAGVRGIRLNLATGGTNDPAIARQRFQAAIERVQRRNWHIQMYTNLATISAIKDLGSVVKL